MMLTANSVYVSPLGLVNTVRRRCATLNVSMACVRHNGVPASLDGVELCVINWSVTKGVRLTATAITALASANQGGMGVIVL